MSSSNPTPVGKRYSAGSSARAFGIEASWSISVPSRTRVRCTATIRNRSRAGCAGHSTGSRPVAG
jgi:hypothetical protein